MKVGFIPPIQHLREYGLGYGNFALLLSDLMNEFPEYTKYYRTNRIANGTFLCLDNSAHEKGTGNDPEILWAQAYLCGANELVAPDCLDNYPETVRRSLAAAESWSRNSNPLLESIMYVPQGKDLLEWYHCLIDLIQIHETYLPTLKLTIGLSKDYEVWTGGLLHIIDEYLSTLRRQHNFAVHLLGWGRDLWALRRIGSIHPWIRSTDSAKPFVYALGDILLDPISDPPRYPGRPSDYFHRSFGDTQSPIAQQNANTFILTAQGRAYGPEE